MLGEFYAEELGGGVVGGGVFVEDDHAGGVGGDEEVVGAGDLFDEGGYRHAGEFAGELDARGEVGGLGANPKRLAGGGLQVAHGEALVDGFQDEIETGVAVGGGRLVSAGFEERPESGVGGFEARGECGDGLHVGLVGGGESLERHGEDVAVLTFDLDRVGVDGFEQTRGDGATVGIGPRTEIVGFGCLKGEAAREVEGNQASEELERFHKSGDERRPATGQHARGLM